MIKWLIKKYVIGKVNDLLREYRDDIAKVTETIDLWIGRLEKITSQLRKINGRVADGEITADEIRQSTEEIETLVKEF